MTTLKTIVAAAVVSLIVVLVAVPMFSKPAVEQKDQNVGSVASPDIQSPYFSFGGVRHWAGRSDYSLTNATTTPCAIQSPVSTSTLRVGSFRISSTSASAAYVEFGKSTTPYATTTSLGITTVGSNVQGTLIATSTVVNGTMLDNSVIFAPSTYLVLKVAGAGAAQLGGTCIAEWIEL